MNACIQQSVRPVMVFWQVLVGLFLTPSAVHSADPLWQVHLVLEWCFFCVNVNVCVYVCVCVCVCGVCVRLCYLTNDVFTRVYNILTGRWST